MAERKPTSPKSAGEKSQDAKPKAEKKPESKPEPVAPKLVRDITVNGKPHHAGEPVPELTGEQLERLKRIGAIR